MNAPAEVVDVVVGLIEDARGRVLVNQRRRGTHLAGAWEFPGGKRGAGEARFDALVRELGEELGIRPLAAEPLLEVRHDYPDKRVRLDVWIVRSYQGEPRARERQPLAWVAPEELAGIGLLAADRPIVEALLARKTRA